MQKLNPLPEILNCPSDFKSFISDIRAQVPEIHKFDDSDILISFYNRTILPILPEIENTLEFQQSKNPFKSLSFILYTEISDGAQDYTPTELEFMQLFINCLAQFHPEMHTHKNTKLFTLHNN
jgi:hypothetical protein